MNKLLIVLSVVIVIVVIGGGAFYLLHNNNSIKTANTVNTQQKVLSIPVEKPEDTIKKLDTAYWQAVQYNDYATAYDFFQPVDKALISKTDYVKKQEADQSLTTITGTDIVGITVTGNTAIEHIMIKGNTGNYPGTDNFILIDGKWYKVMSDANKKFLGIGQ